MVSSGPYGWGKWRSKRSRLFFCLLDYFYGQKRPQNAINGVYPAISPPGGSKLVVLRGSRLDLSRKHPGRCVGTIFRIWNCHRGAPECPKSASKCQKWGWSKSIVLESKVAINFDFRSKAIKSGHLDYPLQSYGPKQVNKNHVNSKQKMWISCFPPSQQMVKANLFSLLLAGV